MLTSVRNNQRRYSVNR